MCKIKWKDKRFGSTLLAAYDQRSLFSGFPCSPLCSRSITVLLLFVESGGWSSRLRRSSSSDWTGNTSSVRSAFCRCWRNMLNKQARSNQGENATMPLWEMRHHCFGDNGEESNENKRVALCCTFSCLKGIWLANDINRSIKTRSLEITEVQKNNQLSWVCGEEKMHSWSIIYVFQRLTQSDDVELAESNVSTIKAHRLAEISKPNMCTACFYSCARCWMQRCCTLWPAAKAAVDLK